MEFRVTDNPVMSFLMPSENDGEMSLCGEIRSTGVNKRYEITYTKAWKWIFISVNSTALSCPLRPFEGKGGPPDYFHSLSFTDMGIQMSFPQWHSLSYSVSLCFFR